MIDCLPACLDVERFVLGSVLLDDGLVPEVRDAVQPEHFSIEKHRRIWGAITALFEAGKPVDRITVYTELRNRGQSESCDGLSYLISLDEGLPQLPHIDSYIQTLRNLSARRRIILQADKLQAMAAADDCDLSAVQETMRDMAAGVEESSDSSGLVSTRDLLASVGIEGLLRPRSIGNGISLPWQSLSFALAGFQAGQVIVLMADTSKGKTAFASQVATHATLKGILTDIWSMEMGPESLFRRMIAQVSGFPLATRPGQSTFQEREAHVFAAGKLADNPIWFDTKSRSVSQFVRRLRACRAKLGIVDYLQLIGRGGGTSSRSRAQEVSDNSRQLKLGAMELGIPILVLSQVDRSSVKGQDSKISLHSAKESGDIENDSDVELSIGGAEFVRDIPSEAPIWILKQREGPKGFSIPMIFHPLTQTFQEVSQ